MKSRAGFVLVAALWFIVALSAVGLDTALRSQARRTPALNQLDMSRAREAAQAGTDYARSRLSAAMREYQEEVRAQARRAQAQRSSGSRSGSSRSTSGGRDAVAAVEDPWREPHGLIVPELALGDAAFTVDVRDTGAALNISEATEDMLRAFLSQGLRLDFAHADRLTQSILDWGDADDLPRINGGEREQYLSAGAAVLPANQPFRTVDELRHVMGMTPEVLELMRPYLTVVGSGRINLNSAPEPVLMAVPSITPAAATALLRLRETGQYPRNLNTLRDMLGRSYNAPSGRDANEFNRRVTYATNEVEIIAHGSMQGSAVTSVVRTVVARAGSGAVVVWRRVE